ncbi:hypothetical protein C8T65DRAFT_296417 [Cerioporus squamosus]|nr:hypothetical protein C8T65DRAFT_296417 [Cerioporus squamosus]
MQIDSIEAWFEQKRQNEPPPHALVAPSSLPVKRPPRGDNHPENSTSSIPARKIRTKWSDAQLAFFESYLFEHGMPDPYKRTELAQEFGVNRDAIRGWFIRRIDKAKTREEEYRRLPQSLKY